MTIPNKCPSGYRQTVKLTILPWYSFILNSNRAPKGSKCDHQHFEQEKYRQLFYYLNCLWARVQHFSDPIHYSNCVRFISPKKKKKEKKIKQKEVTKLKFIYQIPLVCQKSKRTTWAYLSVRWFCFNQKYLSCTVCPMWYENLIKLVHF